MKVNLAFLLGLIWGIIITGCVLALVIGNLRHDLRSKNGTIAKLRRQR